MTDKIIEYAILHIKARGIVKPMKSDNNTVYVQLEDGSNLQLHDNEIHHQAVEYLRSEIEQVKQG